MVPSPKLDLDGSVEDDVELLLGLVEVIAGVVPGRDDDPVHPELLDAEPAADLPEPRPLTEVVESGDGPAVATLDRILGGHAQLSAGGGGGGA